MKIVSWNCRYGLNEEKANIILELYPDTDIFVIQECKKSDIDIFRDNWKFKNWYGDDQDIKSNLGIAIFSKSYEVEFTEVFNRKYRYVVPYKVILNKETEKSFIIFAVWTKSEKGGNYKYDENVTKAINSPEYKELLKGDVIIIGDFNTGYREEYRKRYSDLCKNLKGFKNCTLGKPKELNETFYSYRERKLFLNDFCFVSENLYSNLKSTEIHDAWEENSYGHKSWQGLSDHCPISVEFDL